MQISASFRLLMGGAAAALAFVGICGPASADDSQRLLTIDHYVLTHSIVPAIKGQPAQIYVREKARAATMARESGGANNVVLFVHGAGTPAEVAFDVPYQDYSWMAYLARAGFDVFSMDTTGYGRSTRPAPMNDPCNLAPDQQPRLTPARCAATYPYQLTTLESDWNDVGAVVDYLRSLRHVDRISLVGWSLGGPRSAGYAAQHPDKIARLVLLAPAYNRDAKANPPGEIPFKGVAMNTQSRAEFDANWDRQVGCPDQYDPAASQSVWTNMLASDPVGATWGTGVRRAPVTTSWGWTSDVVKKTTIPILMVSGAHDKQVPQQRVRDMYADLGSPQKIFIDLVCSSHNAMWEKNHRLLFQASLEWLQNGTVNGMKTGMLRFGYPD
ncbi:MAG TPA: alpha/beta fold hydrolase [Micropepsaceae bacterium]|jgi:pimeloyl-ACP methyl ester carboxylesterase